MDKKYKVELLSCSGDFSVAVLVWAIDADDAELLAVKLVKERYRINITEWADIMIEEVAQ